MARRAEAAGRRRERPASDALRRDVRLLTTMLGEAIATSGGPELLADVEALRTATIALRGRPSDARRRRVVALVDALDPVRAEDVIRAFTCYFQLVNLAEERERVRVLADRSRSGEPVEDSIAALDVDGASLVDVRITPVLTAHPTEAKRRAVVEHLWRIAGLLERIDETRLGAPDRLDVDRRMREEIAGLWRTEPIRRHGPSRSTRSARCSPCSTRRSSRRSLPSTGRWTGASIPRGAGPASPRSVRSCAGGPGWEGTGTATRA